MNGLLSNLPLDVTVHFSALWAHHHADWTQIRYYLDEAALQVSLVRLRWSCSSRGPAYGTVPHADESSTSDQRVPVTGILSFILLSMGCPCTKVRKRCRTPSWYLLQTCVQEQIVGCSASHEPSPRVLQSAA